MSATRKKYRVGELRPSQVLFTHGIGAIVDLPYISTMVMGLDDWENPYPAMVGEERLLQAVRAILGPQVLRLLAPPEAPESVGGPPNPFDESALVGVPVAAFPRWMLCPRCRTLASLDSDLFQLKADFYRADKTRYVHVNCASAGAPPPVVPARFLVACKNGHLDDFPWIRFVHGEVPCRARLKLRELGVTGEAADIQVLCDTCGKQKRMSDAFGVDGMKNLPECNGRHPHLRRYDKEPCQEQSRTILLGASNSWFSLVLSTLAVPNAVDKLGQLLEEHWHLLGKVTSQQNIELLRQIGQLEHFSPYTDAHIWEQVEARKNASEASDASDDTPPPSLKAPEWKVLSNPLAAPEAHDFKVRTVAPPQGYEQVLKQVVLVERLREVRALIGFSRIESPGDFSEVVEIPEERRVPLSRKRPTWVPATEVRGEGIFLEFREDAIVDWMGRSVSHRHEHTFFGAHMQWRKARRMEDPALGYPGLRYVLLHEAACHACLFLPETSCERGNKYLDRSVLVPTVDRTGLAFFDMIE